MPTLSHEIDAICDQFESSWRTHRRPQIETYLEKVEPKDRRSLLRELLFVEIEYRLQSDERLNADEFHARFPNEEDVVNSVFFAASTTESLTINSILGAPDTTVEDMSATSRLSRDAKLALHERMEDLEFAKGEHLIRQGERGDSLMMIVGGSAEVIAEDRFGNRETLGRVVRGQIVGEMALLTDEPRTANVIALERVRVRALSAAAFHELVQQFPEISVLLTKLIGNRVGWNRRDVLIGRTLGGYQVERRLGRGGMGVVYEAIDPSSGQHVALKMMNHRLVHDDEALKQFHREADIIESFDHDNIIRMFGRFAAFRTFVIVLEYCDGVTLREKLDTEQALDVGELRRVLGQLARAVDYAHSQKVIHRDLKPSNIMLTPERQVRLMDFGLAQPFDLGTDRIVGTPPYMAPELFTGSEASEVTDYFAFGCIAFELLVGRPFFDTASFDRLQTIHRTWHVPAIPSALEVPSEISRMLDGALTKDPTQRRLDLKAIGEWS